MKIKSLPIFLVAVAFFIQASAQQNVPPEKLSLKKAQETALENNPDVEVKNLNVAISRKQAEQARWKKIPDIYANYDLKRNLIIPTTPVPAKAFNPDAPEGAIMPLKFMTNWTSNAGLNAGIDLFNPQTHGQVKEAEQNAALSNTDKEIAANNLKYRTGTDYGACIIAAEQLKLARADTAARNKILKMTREQYEAGRLKITDLNQAQSQKSKAVSNFLEAEKILASARIQLLVDMGFDPSGKYSFILTDSLQGLLPEFQKQSDQGENSLSLKKWNQQKALTEIQLQNARATYWPTISLNGFYGTNYYDNDFDLFNHKNWYGNSYVGLSIKVPITEGLDRVKRIEALRLQREADQANYRSQKNQIQSDKIQALQDLNFKEKDLLQKKEDMKLNRKNFQTATEQFSAGRLLSGDLATSAYAYQQAKTAYLQAAYDFVVAKMKLQKASRE